MRTVLLSLVLSFIFISGHAQSDIDIKSLRKYDGYFDFYYSEKEDKLFLEVTALDKEFLYVNSLSQGIGSNDIGLDRGQLGNSQVVYFKKAGNKLLLVQPNLKYRANTDNVLEKASVEQAFAKSVLFGFPIEQDTKGGFLIDMTPFLMEDAHDVAGRLKRGEEGSYSVDESRSALALERIKAFPKNVEFEALLTFKGTPKGKYLSSVTPNAHFVTVYQHHSFIELPDNNYKARVYNPQSGAFDFSYRDYATPIEESIEKKFVHRHRLVKTDPTAQLSSALEPIIYYLDNGTPEPIRSALLDGGRWWNQAFEAIGYQDAFQFKILPDDADPMDIRYNVVQWVHRSTRGWSYGGTVSDPRTGEIIKGHVSLGSLRVRQDFLIAQALSKAPFAEHDKHVPQMLEMALARIRQLSAHEIGHTLGFAHNFAASTNNRASVMDYPHPYVTLENGAINLRDAYAVGIGEWDKVSVAYSYSQFADAAAEKAGLKAILETANKKGLRYISDGDARSQGGAHAYAHLWDNGEDPVAELVRLIKVREQAIKQFSVDNIRDGEPLSLLDDVFVPLYFFHRYQTEAAVKLVGGMDYHYGLKGDGLPLSTVLPPDQQRNALKAILATLDAEFLAIPREQLKLFAPKSVWSRGRESFKGKTGVAYDALGASATAAQMTVRLLLHPERASRIVQQIAMDSTNLGLREVVEKLIKKTLHQSSDDAYLFSVQQSVNAVVLQELMRLAQDKNAYPQVRSIVNERLKIFEVYLKAKRVKNYADLGYLHTLRLYFENPESIPSYDIPKIPDGSPIGSDDCSYGSDVLW